MKHYDRIELGTREVNINNIPVIVGVFALLHYDACYQLYGDFEPGEKEALESKITSGELTPTIIEVIAVADDCENGHDSLCGCFLESERDAQATISENGMVDRAIAELIAVTRSRAASLAKFVA